MSRAAVGSSPGAPASPDAHPPPPGLANSLPHVGELLKERGILPWLDIWEIQPGTRWQRELQKQLKSIKSAAVFIGPRGAGPWQELEVESLLGQIAKRNRPMIPVILEGRASNPRLPAFLDMWHVVDMRQPDPDPFEQLVWVITGERRTELGAALLR